MGRMKENPRYKVISCRGTDDEKALIVEAARAANVSLGEFLRDAAIDAAAKRLAKAIPGVR